MIREFVHQAVDACGVTGDAAGYVSHAILVVVAILIAALAGWLCRRLVVPSVLKLTAKTEAKWDDALFNRDVLMAACSIVPAIVIWRVLPWTFNDFPTVREVLTRLTAIYITVMSVRTLVVFIDSFKRLENGPRSARQQYIYSVCGVMMAGSSGTA